MNVRLLCSIHCLHKTERHRNGSMVKGSKRLSNILKYTKISSLMHELCWQIDITTVRSDVDVQWKYILKINKNATLVFSRYFQHELVNQNFVFIRLLYLTYSIKRLFCVLIDCQYHCLTVLVQKQVIWLPVMFHMSDLYFSSRSCRFTRFTRWVDDIFPASKCRYVFSIIFED